MYEVPEEILYALREARSEIRRHHEDFEKIRAILSDTKIEGWPADDVNRGKLQKIRNIVG